MNSLPTTLAVLPHRVSSRVLLALGACLGLASSTVLAAGQNVEAKGVVIDQVVAGSPEAAAGLRDGDVVLRCDKRPLTSPQQLRGMLRNTFSKKRLELELQRGATISLRVPYFKLASKGRPPMSEPMKKSFLAALALKKSKKFAAAMDSLAAMAERAATSKDRVLTAWLYQQAGFLASDQRQREKSHAWHLMSWQQIKETKDRVVKSSVLSALGAECRRMNRFQEAEKWFKLAVGEYQALGFEWSAAIDLNNIGRVIGMSGELRRCEAFLEQSLAIHQRLQPDSQAVADCLNNLGNVSTMTGRLARGGGYYQQALRIYERRDPRSIPTSRALNNLASLANARGELALAYDYLLKSLEIKEAVAPGSQDVAQALANLGTVAKQRGDFLSARDYDEQALKILEERAPNSLAMARTCASLATVCTTLREDEQADRFLKRAKKLFEKIAPTGLDMALLVGNHGSTLMAQGKLDAAEKELRRGLELARQSAPGFLLEAVALTNLGELHNRRGHHQQAMKYFEQAKAICERVGPSSKELADVISSIANLKGSQGQLKEAAQLFERSIKIVESRRAKVTSADARRQFVNHFQVSYTGLIRCRIAMRKYAAAFTALERARARSIMDWLFERRSQMNQQGPPELLERQEQLDLQQSSLYRRLGQLHPKRDAESIQQVHQQLTSVAARQRELELRIRTASPKFASLHYPQPLDGSACQRALDKGTLLLRYFVDKDKAFLFAVRGSGAADESRKSKSAAAEGIRVFSVELTRKQIRNKIIAFRDKIAKRQSIDKEARELFHHLVEPAREMVDRAERLLICPDDMLHVLPFAALIADGSEDNPRYLTDLKPLHTISSITIYAQMRRQKRNTTAPKLVAFGNPNYGGSLLAFSPNRGLTLVNAKTGEKQPTGKKNSPPAATGVLSHLPALPGTGEEVESLSKLYGQEATVLVGRNASEAAAKSATQSATMLHFACHGLVDHHDPFASGVALSPGKDEDGILRAWEVVKHLKLKCDLVVLSACDSGLGMSAQHEGVIGLTTAFQYAGARSIVVSNWSIPDKSTAALMGEFYKQLRQGISKDEALRRASLAVRSRKEWQHPLHWAAFQLIGDWQK